MPLLSLVKQTIRMQPLPVGCQAPPLSLTADEGTWIRLTDFKGHLNIVLVFFRDAADPATAQMLRAFSQQMGQFEQLETVVFGISTARTDKLRQVRADLGLPFFLLYDPFAVESRRFGCSGRIRPTTRAGYAVIAKDGTISLSAKGTPPIDQILAHLAHAEGRTLGGAGAVAAPPEAAWKVRELASDEAVNRLQTDKRFKLVDVRTRSEFEADHSSQAIHLPVDELPARYRELGQTTHLLFICQTGDRSAQAAAFLASIGGREVYNVSAGMTGWTGDRSSLTSV